MHREPDTTGPQWVPLHEAAERLSQYLGLHTRFVLDDVLARGLVPVLAARSDMRTSWPDRVEASARAELLIRPRFVSEETIRQILAGKYAPMVRQGILDDPPRSG
jgi:hypothetical protein